VSVPELVRPAPAVAPEPEIKRDRWGRYVIPDPETGKEISWTRATTFAKTIGDTFALHKWQLRMLLKGLALRPDLMAMASATDVRDDLDKIAQDAMEAAGSKVGANIGTAVHALTEKVDGGELVTGVPPLLTKLIDSYAAALPAHNLRTLSSPGGPMIEKVIICPDLGVAGTLDRILYALDAVGTWTAGDRMIGDVKTAKNIGYAWMEIAVQLAIYAHASAIWNPKTREFEEMPKVDQRIAVVMHCPVPETADDGYTDLYQVDIATGWEYALLSKLVRTARSNKRLAVRLGQPMSAQLSAGSLVAPAKAPEPIDYRARIDEATCKADLSAIWSEAMAAGKWTDELEAYGLGKMKDLRG
jgi:hypothetical protein